ncbi:hypothetical protein [Clostridium sp.]
MKLLKDIFGTVQQISPFVFALRTIVVGSLLYVEGKVLPYRFGGQFAGYDFEFFWMMGGITAAPLFEAKISFINTVVIVVVQKKKKILRMPLKSNFDKLLKTQFYW